MNAVSIEWRNELKAICDHYLKDYPHYWREIPAKKESAIRRSHRIPPSETIVALLDHSLTNSAKDGLVLTDSALYRKVWWFRYRCSWDAYIHLDIKAENKETVYFSEYESVNAVQGMSAYQLEEILKEIQSLAAQYINKLKAEQESMIIEDTIAPREENNGELSSLAVNGASSYSELSDLDIKVDEQYIRELCSRHQGAPHFTAGTALTQGNVRTIQSHFSLGDTDAIHGIASPRKFMAGRHGMVIGARGVQWKKDKYPPVNWGWSVVRRMGNLKLEITDHSIAMKDVLLLKGPTQYVSTALKVLDDIQLYLEALEADDCPIRYAYDGAYSNVRAMPTVSESDDTLWVPAENGMPLAPMRTNELKWAIETGQVDWQTLMVWRRGLSSWKAAELIESLKSSHPVSDALN